jgi:signal transduction histidine kinase
MTEMVVMHELLLNELGAPINYRVIDCNNAFVELIKLDKENIIGKLSTELYQTEFAPYLEEYTRVVITGESFEHNIYYAPLDKHLLISAVSTGENMFSTIVTDITAIQHAKDVIIAKNKELENYIYVASHDLRSPLVNIQGFSQRLEKQIDEIAKMLDHNQIDTNLKTELTKITSVEIPKSLNFITSNVSKMDALIKGLLQLSRTGRVVMNIKKVDMNKLMNDVISVHNFQLSECDSTVIISDLASCYGDENQLNQVFSNVINNAIKYRDENRKLIIEISSQTIHNKLIYSIKDSGIGINQRHWDKIWDVFYRVDSASHEAGEGLGLSLARRIVDKHKGKIWAESEEGKGSIFYVELQKNEFEK